jgi:membrane protein
MVWSCEVRKESFLKAKLGDLLVLVGLGLGILLSLALTSGGTAAAHALLETVGLADTVGMGTLVGALGILLGLAADTVLFMWLFTRLPRRPVRYRTVLRGALLAAVGYEILKVVGTTYIAKVTNNPTYGVFAAAVGLLVWIDLVSRFLLLAAAWTATGRQPESSGGCETVPEEGFSVPVSSRPPESRDAPRPAAVAGALVGTGALIGAGATAAGSRYLRRRRPA